VGSLVSIDILILEKDQATTGGAAAAIGPTQISPPAGNMHWGGPGNPQGPAAAVRLFVCSFELPNRAKIRRVWVGNGALG
jgi:hypothetical protein